MVLMGLAVVTTHRSSSIRAISPNIAAAYDSERLYPEGTATVMQKPFPELAHPRCLVGDDTAQGFPYSLVGPLSGLRKWFIRGLQKIVCLRPLFVFWNPSLYTTCYEGTEADVLSTYSAQACVVK